MRIFSIESLCPALWDPIGEILVISWDEVKNLKGDSMSFYIEFKVLDLGRA